MWISTSGGLWINAPTEAVRKYNSSKPGVWKAQPAEQVVNKVPEETFYAFGRMQVGLTNADIAYPPYDENEKERPASVEIRMGLSRKRHYHRPKHSTGPHYCKIWTVLEKGRLMGRAFQARGILAEVRTCRAHEMGHTGGARKMELKNPPATTQQPRKDVRNIHRQTANQFSKRRQHLPNHYPRKPQDQSRQSTNNQKFRQTPDALTTTKSTTHGAIPRTVHERPGPDRPGPNPRRTPNAHTKCRPSKNRYPNTGQQKERRKKKQERQKRNKPATRGSARTLQHRNPH